MNIKAHAIALQEVCPDQVAWLQANLGGRWTISVNPGTKTARVGCDLPGGLHDKPANVAIWTGGSDGKVSEYASLSNPANSAGSMACVHFERSKVPVHLCSAHLISADWVDPNTQIAYDGKVLRLAQTTKLKQLARDSLVRGQQEPLRDLRR